MTSSEWRQKLVAEALSYIDQPLDWPTCSRFIVFLLQKISFPLPEDIRFCNDFFDRFGITIHSEVREAGDLVFFSKAGIYPSHMGIMIDRDRYIHARYRTIGRVTIGEIAWVPLKPRPGQHYCISPIGFKRPAERHGRYHELE